MRVGVPAPLLVSVVVAAALASGLTAGLCVSRGRGWRVPVTALASIAAVGSSVFGGAGPELGVLVLGSALLAGAATAVGSPRFSRRWPAGGPPRWGPVAGLLVAVLVLLQLGRLATFVVDPTRTGSSMLPPLHTRHSCLTGPLEAAARAVQGSANVYSADLFPDPQEPPERWPTTALDTRPFAVEPFVWAPYFLLLALGLLKLGGSFLGARALWFAVQGVSLVGALLAAVLDGPLSVRRRLLFASGLVLLSPAVLLSLQIGNAQVLAFSAAVLALVALRRGLRWSGALLLSAAILTKLFPAVLLVELAARRRWRDLQAVLVVTAGATALLMLLLGTGPLSSFVGYHLPRLITGDAHPLVQQPSSLPLNHALATFLPRLGALLGFEPPAVTISGLQLLLATAVVALACWCGWNGRGTAPDLVRSLAVVNLASLLGRIAVYPYAVLGTIMLLALGARGRVGSWFALAAGVTASLAPRLLDTREALTYGLAVQTLLVGSSLLVLWTTRSTSRTEPATAVSDSSAVRGVGVRPLEAR